MAAETPCFFEKALVSGSARCGQAKRLDIGERLVYYCRSATAAHRCGQYVSLLRQNARFLFRQTSRGNSTLSNYQEICLQCGGLQGLSTMLDAESAGNDLDVNNLLEAVESEQGGIAHIPLVRIIPCIAAYNPRPHRKKK